MTVESKDPRSGYTNPARHRRIVWLFSPDGFPYLRETSYFSPKGTMNTRTVVSDDGLVGYEELINPYSRADGDHHRLRLWRRNPQDFYFTPPAEAVVPESISVDGPSLNWNDVMNFGLEIANASKRFWK